jgi:hypothetical protein
MRTNAPNLPCPQHILTQSTVSRAGVVFDGQLLHNLAVYAPKVDPGPITASVAAIYSEVPSAARPSVIHAYVKSVGTVHFISGGVGVTVTRNVWSVAGLCLPYGSPSWILDDFWGCIDKVRVLCANRNAPPHLTHVRCRNVNLHVNGVSRDQVLHESVSPCEDSEKNSLQPETVFNI